MRTPKVPRIFAVVSAVFANETNSKRKRSSVRNTDVPNCAVSHQGRNYENNPGTDHEDADLYWQVDAAHLFSLKEKPYRHGELRRRLGRVSQRTLTRTLRGLEYTGLVAKRLTKSTAVAVVEYSLTHLGSTIIAPLRGMRRWAKRYRMNVSADVHFEGA